MGDRDDKRRHHRPLALLEVKVLGAAGAGIPPGLRLATMDVAVGGMRCASNLPLEKGTHLRLSLALEGGDLREPTTIVGDVRVLRCSERPGEPEIRRHEIAMQFVQMSLQDRKRLQSYLNSL
ncbi:MAG: PilZ domain-containing protein [Acidobacteriota bacterium]